MNRDEISRIAQECGLTVEQAFYSPAIQKFASRIESLVIEECARICEEISDANMESEESRGAAWCEDRLRDLAAIRKQRIEI
jgi:hypothetical protein